MDSQKIECLLAWVKISISPACENIFDLAEMNISEKICKIIDENTRFKTIDDCPKMTSMFGYDINKIVNLHRIFSKPYCEEECLKMLLITIYVALNSSKAQYFIESMYKLTSPQQILMTKILKSLFKYVETKEYSDILKCLSIDKVRPIHKICSMPSKVTVQNTSLHSEVLTSASNSILFSYGCLDDTTTAYDSPRRMKNQLSCMENKITNMKSESDVLQKTVFELEDKIYDLEDTIKNLKCELVKRGEELKKIPELRKTICELEVALTEDIANAQDENERLKGELEKLVKIGAKNETLEDKCYNLQRENDELRERVESKFIRREEVVTQTTPVNNKSIDPSQPGRVDCTLTSECYRDDSPLHKFANDFHEYHEHFLKIRDDVEIVEAENERLKCEVTKLREQLAHESQEFKLVTSSIQQLEKEIQEMRRQNNDMEIELAKEKSDNKIQSLDIECLQKELDKMVQFQTKFLETELELTSIRNEYNKVISEREEHLKTRSMASDVYVQTDSLPLPRDAYEVRNISDNREPSESFERMQAITNHPFAQLNSRQNFRNRSIKTDDENETSANHQCVKSEIRNNRYGTQPSKSFVRNPGIALPSKKLTSKQVEVLPSRRYGKYDDEDEEASSARNHFNRNIGSSKSFLKNHRYVVEPVRDCGMDNSLAQPKASLGFVINNTPIAAKDSKRRRPLPFKNDKLYSKIARTKPPLNYLNSPDSVSKHYRRDVLQSLVFEDDTGDLNTDSSLSCYGSVKGRTRKSPQVQIYTPVFRSIQPMNIEEQSSSVNAIHRKSLACPRLRYTHFPTDEEDGDDTVNDAQMWKPIHSSLGNSPPSISSNHEKDFTGRADVSTVKKEFDMRRVLELNRRNTLVRPHLRTTYPVEMQGLKEQSVVLKTPAPEKNKVSDSRGTLRSRTIKYFTPSKMISSSIKKTFCRKTIFGDRNTQDKKKTGEGNCSKKIL